MRKIIMITLVIFALSITGCSNAQKRSTIGVLLGGATGAAIGKNNHKTAEGAAIGSFVGAVLGYGLGNEEDKGQYNTNTQLRPGATTQYRDTKSRQQPYGHWEYYNERIWVEGGVRYAGENSSGNHVLSTTPGWWKIVQRRKWIYE